MRFVLSLVVAVACCAFWAHTPRPSYGADLLAAERPLADVVDEYIDRELQAAGITPAAGVDDATFIRRVTLDLAGRIPTAVEAQSFVQDSDPNKRAALVDRLLASPEYVRYLAVEWDAVLMEGANASIRNYLLAALGANRPWPQLFRELMQPMPSDDPAGKEVAHFLKRRIADHEKLTNDVSVLFFGVNISCAKCHDHPLVSDWKQEHFYGLKSFFARTFEHGDFIGEKAYGQVKFKTTEGEEKLAPLKFLTGEILPEPEIAEPSDEEKKAEQQQLEALKKDKQPAPPPAYSRRAQLVEIALRPQGQELMAKALANRMFRQYLGRGLVMPLDQMHSENPPSHPSLLDWLSRDLIAQGYDLRRMTRGLLLSRAYARDSRWPNGQVPSGAYFAVGAVRALSPQQYAASLRLAVLAPGQFAADVSAEEKARRLEGIFNAGLGLSGLFERPGDDFQVGVGEALWFSNNPQAANDLLSEGGDRLLHQLAKTPDRQEQVALLWWNVFSRAPTDSERTAINAYLSAREDRLPVAWQQIVWSLLTSSEFRFNY